MKAVNLSISPLHAETIATHLLIVIKNYVTGKPAGSISEETMAILKNLDQVYQKLTALSDSRDDESARSLVLTFPEAEAFLEAFTDAGFQGAARRDAFYEKHSYSAYFAQIYAGYLDEVRAGLG